MELEDRKDNRGASVLVFAGFRQYTAAINLDSPPQQFDEETIKSFNVMVARDTGRHLVVKLWQVVRTVLTKHTWLCYLVKESVKKDLSVNSGCSREAVFRTQ